MYHIHPETQEPTYCQLNGQDCSVASLVDHYCSISEAVRERTAKVATASPAVKPLGFVAISA